MSFLNKIKTKGIKQIIGATIPYYIQCAFEPIIKNITLKIYKNKPLQDIIVIESHNDFDSNGGAFYEYLLKEGFNKKYKIVWFLRNKSPSNLPENVIGVRYNRLSFKRWYYQYTAKYIVCGHLFIECLREGQKSYYTTHGAMALKNTKGKVTMPEGVTYILCPSEFLAPIQADLTLMHYPNDKQIYVGYPCHDILYGKATGDLSKITNVKFRKSILWMPTFRKNSENRCDSEGTQPLGIPILSTLEEFEELNDNLRSKDILLIIKIHPMQDISTIRITDMSNVVVLDAKKVKKLNVDNYRLMKDTDALISDYSSSGTDYFHMNKPIAYSLDDKEDYKLGFIVNDPTIFMPGNKIYTISDLYDFIDDIDKGLDRYRQEREEVFGKFFQYHDGESCKRLAQHMGITNY